MVEIERVQEIDVSRRPTLVLSYAGKLSEPILTRLKEQVITTFLGSKVIVLEEGLGLDSVLFNDLVATDGY